MPNRLINQTSPYLQQHAHNPVDWYPWCQEALDRASAENKPLLVSIGYSACHWCHVMERESFEDPATAEVMNSHFINIKIDREERPDLDQVYMDAVQAISGSGGWPLNVFLTPDAKPFYGGTYFPPVRAYNRSSWIEVLHAISTAWQEKPEEILEQAENLTNHIANASLFGKAFIEPVIFNEEILSATASQILKAADTTWGGFGNAPKFPQTPTIQFLLRQYYFFRKSGPQNLPFEITALLKQALLSLDKMMEGGIYDHLGGGFARYSTDTKWLVPHFEKMLYDNALLVSVLSEAYQLTAKMEYRDTIDQTLAFVAREWQDEDGGFFSAFDADSEGEEGLFYTWTKQEVAQLLENEADLFCHYYDITEGGNWEGKNIFWVKKPLEQFCADNHLEVESTRELLRNARQKLWKHREGRPKPLLDDKKLLGWNALMISACCKASAALGNSHYTIMAQKATAFIEHFMADEAGNYFHNYKSGVAANPAFLDDLAFYVEALILLQEATGSFHYLERARSIAYKVINDFGDDDSPFFFYTPSFQTDIIVRKKEVYDGATPAGNSVMALNLLYLGTLLDIRIWKERAFQMVAQTEKTVSRYPTSFGNWAQAIQWLVYGLHEIAVVGHGFASKSAELRKHYIPNRVLQATAGPNSEFPLLDGKSSSDGKTLLYSCREFACNQPVETVEELFNNL